MTKLQTGVSYSKYMALYTVAYNYCTSSRMHGAEPGAGIGGRSKLLAPSDRARDSVANVPCNSGCKSHGF